MKRALLISVLITIATVMALLAAEKGGLEPVKQPIHLLFDPTKLVRVYPSEDLGKGEAGHPPKRRDWQPIKCEDFEGAFPNE